MSIRADSRLESKDEEEYEDIIIEEPLPRVPTDQELNSLMDKIPMKNNHKSLGDHIFKVSVSEFFKLFLDNNSEYTLK